jgi:hypothetical protein
MPPERRYNLVSKMPEVEQKLSTLEFEELALALAVLFFRSILACSSLPAAPSWREPVLRIRIKIPQEACIHKLLIGHSQPLSAWPSEKGAGD